MLDHLTLLEPSTELGKQRYALVSTLLEEQLLAHAALRMSRDRRLGRVLEHVNRHLGQPIPLEDAASIAALSRNYFCSYFRRKVGIGFRCWIERLRIRRAEGLIRYSDQSLTSIAYSVGFQDLRTFQRAFRRQRDSCPSEIQ